MEVHLCNSHHFHFHSPFHSHNSVSASSCSCSSSSCHCFLQDTNRRRSSIPAFGNWEFYEELPITQYFEVHTKPAQHHHKKMRQSVKGTGAVAVVHQNQKQKQKLKQKQSKVCDVIPQTPPKRVKHPKAVDEDLYKIPPELLQQKPNKKRMLGNFLLGCIRMNCISS